MPLPEGQAQSNPFFLITCRKRQDFFSQHYTRKCGQFLSTRSPSTSSETSSVPTGDNLRPNQAHSDLFTGDQVKIVSKTIFKQQLNHSFYAQASRTSGPRSQWPTDAPTQTCFRSTVTNQRCDGKTTLQE